MKDLNLSNEDKLILYNAAMNIDKETAELIPDIMQLSLDWNYIVRTANNHGVAPLLYHNLTGMGFGVVLPEELKAIYYLTSSRSSHLLQEADRILTAFSASNINSIILKGGYLTRLIYKNPALRPLSDIDLLVPKEDLIEVAEILMDSGYILPEYLLPLEIFKKYNFHIPFKKKDDGRVVIEIHWDLRDNFKYSGMDIKSIWDNAVRFEASGCTALAMAPDDLLIYICHHLERHGYMNRFIISRDNDYGFLFLNALSWNRLIWFVDIHEIINYFGESIKFDIVREKINKWDSDGSVASSLQLTNRLFRIGLDMQGLNALPAPRASFFERLLYNFIIKRASVTDWNKDYLLKFYKKRIIEGSRRFPFRPIRLIELNCRILFLFIRFPVELSYHLIRRFFSGRAHG